MEGYMMSARLKTRQSRTAVGQALSKIILYVIVIIGAVLSFLPFYWMLVLATHSTQTIFHYPPPLLPGNHLVANYLNMLKVIPFWKNFLNSLIVASVTTFLTLLFCSMGGYAFAMYRFPGRNQLFSLMLGTMMVPSLVMLIPWFIVISRIGWINDLKALIVPGAVSAFGIFWMRQYVLANISAELVDAARVDGCSEFAIFFRIIAPLLKPAYGALGIMTFMGSWNAFFYPLVVLKKVEVATLPLALQILRGDPYRGGDYGVLMFGTALAMLPILIAFWAASRQFISGLTAGALKG
jgi:ABC-type glycerol-3-phosphate transport system permease component